VATFPQRGGQLRRREGTPRKPTADRLVDAYLKRLERELADLPRGRRRELVGEIADHIAEARAALPHEGEAEIRTLLDQVGDPADIADEARERFEVRPRRRGVTEIVTLILLLVGGFVFVVGWFVGLVLLWVSDAWTTREKLVGTLLVPGGLLPAFLMFSGGIGMYEVGCYGEEDPATGQFVEVCTGGPSTAARILWLILFAVCIVGPFFTTAFLARRMRRDVDAYQPSAGSA
jgi:hypothetical protein